MYTDFDEKIENEIIILLHLTKKKIPNYYHFIYNEEEEEKEEKENKKITEKLNNKSLKLYYRINKGKNKELKSTFKTPKLNIKSKSLVKLGKGKFIEIVNNELKIYESKYLNKLFNIKIEKDFEKIMSVIELDNNDIICLILNNFNYKLLIYRLKDNKYSLFQELEENSKGYMPQNSYSGCFIELKIYKMKFLEKLSKNKFISISNYGYKIYYLNENNKYSVALMDVYTDGNLKINEINKKQLIFCSKVYFGESLFGHDRIKIDEVEICEIPSFTISSYILSSLSFLFTLFTKSEKETIPSPKLESSYKCLFKYSTYEQQHTLSDSIILNNKYFLTFVDNHLLIFNLIKFELIKRYTFLEKGKANSYKNNYNIQKWNKSNDNEFLVILKDNITLLELNEINTNGKIKLDLKVIGYTYLPFSNYSSFVKLDEENRFYIKKRSEILLY